MVGLRISLCIIGQVGSTHVIYQYHVLHEYFPHLHNFSLREKETVVISSPESNQPNNKHELTVILPPFFLTMQHVELCQHAFVIIKKATWRSQKKIVRSFWIVQGLHSIRSYFPTG